MKKIIDNISLPEDGKVEVHISTLPASFYEDMPPFETVYIAYSREDPHYPCFLELYKKDKYLRSYFDRSVLELGKQDEREKFWFKYFISCFFESQYRNILDMDIQGLYNEINEDYRRFS